MLSRSRVALKFMTYGVLIGVIFAPRSGSETRNEIMELGRLAHEWAVRRITGLTRTT